MLCREEALNKLESTLLASKNKFVYKQFGGSCVYFREPSFQVLIDTRKQLRQVKETPEARMKARPKAAVVVLGDIGRSPRMCYHAHSLATVLNYDVVMVGYLDTYPHEIIRSNPNITYQPISPPPGYLSMLPLKFLWTMLMLAYALLFKVSFRLNLILMQNPPALPTMLVCSIVARLKGAQFIIDWHNYMYTVLCDKYNIPLPTPSVDYGEDKSDDKESVSIKDAPRRRVFKADRNFGPPNRKKKSVSIKEKKKKSFLEFYVDWIYWGEGRLGLWADGCLCVTKAMRDDLRNTWGIHAAVLYDRPALWNIDSTSVMEKHDLFNRLAERYPAFKDGTGQGNAFTHINDSGEVELKERRPLLAMSSTSWTPDEDFSILLDAIVQYDKIAQLTLRDPPRTRLPRIVLVITGKGPMKDEYMEKINRLNLEMVEVLTPWLEAEDYPKLLAAADIGICLHTSTSGLDLPMKVVDMFGTGLPVLAKRFACIDELIKDGYNGLLFDSSADLSDKLTCIATGFPVAAEKLKELSANLREDPLASWEENWKTNASSLFQPTRNMALERILAREGEGAQTHSIADDVQTN